MLVILTYSTFLLVELIRWLVTEKKNGAKHGSFLLINGVSISPPEKNIDADSSKEQLNLYGRLKIKHRAFEILEILRVKTGEIMRSEGEALQIFDKFIEYQEYYTRSNQPPPVETERLKAKLWRRICELGTST